MLSTPDDNDIVHDQSLKHSIFEEAHPFLTHSILNSTVFIRIIEFLL